MTLVTKPYADQIGKDRGEAMDRIIQMNETPTPSDSSMTAARLEPKRLAAIRDFAAKDAYYNNDLATELLSHIDAVEAERTKLAADLARAEGERDRINDAAMLASGAAIEACNEMDAAIARALAAEAKSARLANRPAAILAWAVEMFGPVAADADERTFRFVEEAIELAQARGIQRADIDAIAGRVFSRDPGAVPREIGQCQLTLEALAAQAGVDASHEAHIEFDRVREIPKAEWARRHAAKTKLGITADARPHPPGAQP